MECAKYYAHARLSSQSIRDGVGLMPLDTASVCMFRSGRPVAGKAILEKSERRSSRCLTDL